MMRHALQLCCDEHKLHRMQLFVDEGNEVALAFYRKHGFHTDGFMREASKIGDKYVGWYCLSMLQRQWQANSGQQVPGE
jgi:RimJ/RimL family protein N-acetyltransferase